MDTVYMLVIVIMVAGVAGYRRLSDKVYQVGLKVRQREHRENKVMEYRDLKRKVAEAVMRGGVDTETAVAVIGFMANAPNNLSDLLLPTDRTNADNVKVAVIYDILLDIRNHVPLTDDHDLRALKDLYLDLNRGIHYIKPTRIER